MAAIIPATLRLIERGSFLLKAKRPVHLDIFSQPVFSVLGPLSESPQHMASLDCRAPNAVSRGFGLCLCGSLGFFSSSAGCYSVVWCQCDDISLIGLTEGMAQDSFVLSLSGERNCEGCSLKPGLSPRPPLL